MGRAIPGFGGLFYDAAGFAHVYLRDPSAPAALKSLGGQVRVHRGDYELARLVEWKRALRPALLGQPGVVFLDADEAANRVVVGIDSRGGADRERLAAALDARGVPRAAVVFREARPFRAFAGPAAGKKRPVPTATLRDGFRPVPGGVQLGGGCTLGFNAWLGDAFGFVLNSHCTGARDVVDGARYYQGDRDDLIATEIADPPAFTTAPCAAGRKCRYSDSAFARYDGDSTRLGGLGQLARPSARGELEGSLTLKPASSRFNVAGTASPLVGQVVNKIGRTTGWTFGAVLGTCVDIDVFGDDRTMLCQTIARGGATYGDSGSPVFTWTRGKLVRLTGILWGVDESGDGFAFSPFESIQRELGALRVK
jgi:hypothetical protein